MKALHFINEPDSAIMEARGMILTSMRDQLDRLIADVDTLQEGDPIAEGEDGRARRAQPGDRVIGHMSRLVRQGDLIIEFQVEMHPPPMRRVDMYGTEMGL